MDQKRVPTKRVPTSRERRMLDLAAKQASTSSFPSFKHGAVLAKGASVLNLGVNKNQFNSFGKYKYRSCEDIRFMKEPWHATMHAELGCILGVDRESTSGSTVYVVRVNPLGVWRMSKPCCMCQSAMRYVGIRRVVYSVDEKHIGEMKL